MSFPKILQQKRRQKNYYKRFSWLLTLVNSLKLVCGWLLNFNDLLFLLQKKKAKKLSQKFSWLFTLVNSLKLVCGWLLNFNDRINLTYMSQLNAWLLFNNTDNYKYFRLTSYINHFNTV